jgi:hypothetical protein
MDATSQGKIKTSVEIQFLAQHIVSCLCSQDLLSLQSKKRVNKIRGNIDIYDGKTASGEDLGLGLEG